MDNRQLERLLNKYLANECTEAERALVETWYNNSATAHGKPIPTAEIEADIAAIRNALPPASARPVISWRRYAAAAAVVFIVFAGAWAFLTSPLADRTMAVAPTEDILPGGNRAVLKLADGRTVDLSEAQAGIIVGNGLTYLDGSAVLGKRGNEGTSEQAQGSAHGGLPTSDFRLTTPKGGTYQITLPDGTKVWLNAASTLKYSSVGGGTERSVELEGEGYFEVARDVSRPFKVVTKGQVVEVLGTHFNINSYPDEPTTKTTLVEGSVRVVGAHSKQRQVLKPGQQAVLNRDNNLAVHQVTVADAIAWKSELFSFNNADIETIMRQLARWYDVEVVFEGEKPDITLWGEVYRDVKASEALEILKFFNLSYRITTVGGVKKIIIQG